MNKMLISLLLATSLPANAVLYKCIANGKTTYQSIPCKKAGKVFEIRREISDAKQKAARNKLNQSLTADTEKNRLAKIANDKERLIQAEEDKAHASYLNAMESARQADEMEYRNDIEAAKLRKSYGY